MSDVNDQAVVDSDTTASEEIVDVESTEVKEEETPDLFKEQEKLEYKERRQIERQRARALNKLLKDYRRRQKNPLNIARKLSK